MTESFSFLEVYDYELDSLARLAEYKYASMDKKELSLSFEDSIVDLFEKILNALFPKDFVFPNYCVEEFLNITPVVSNTIYGITRTNTIFDKEIRRTIDVDSKTIFKTILKNFVSFWNSIVSFLNEYIDKYPLIPSKILLIAIIRVYPNWNENSKVCLDSLNSYLSELSKIPDLNEEKMKDYFTIPGDYSKLEFNSIPLFMKGVSDLQESLKGKPVNLESLFKSHIFNNARYDTEFYSEFFDNYGSKAGKELPLVYFVCSGLYSLAIEENLKDLSFQSLSLIFGLEKSVDLYD